MTLTPKRYYYCDIKLSKECCPFLGRNTLEETKERREDTNKVRTLVAAGKLGTCSVKGMMDNKTAFGLLLSGMSKRLLIPGDVLLIIKQYYTRFYTLAINMYIAYNYTSSVHDLQLFNLIKESTHTYRTYNYNRDHSHNNGLKVIINKQPLPLYIQKRCSFDGMNELTEAQIACSKWSMVSLIGSKCELNAFHPNLVSRLGTNSHSPIDEYGVYKFALPSFPFSSRTQMPQKPTSVTYNHRTKCLYAMNTHCETEYFQRDSNKIYTLDFKV